MPVKNLIDADDSNQAQQRRRISWSYLFGDTAGFENPADLQTRARDNIEAIWSRFFPSWKNRTAFLTSDDLRRNDLGLTLAKQYYYIALVTSGVADRSVGVAKSTSYPGTIRGGKAEIDVAGKTDIYEFPGGAKVTRNPRQWDYWFGSLSVELPPSPKN